jgi:putative nucleotidyltransferase with HDIG domain
LAVGLIYASYPGNQFNFLWHATFGMISGIGTGILTLGILPLIESTFKLITPYTLLELGNHDRPILKRLQLEAPGTFHHSVMVASLAEAASEAIGANPILARVGSLYHDIGKIKRPLFFIENQSYFGVENPHDKLTPRLSKMVITAHPRDGVEIAKQLNLPDVLMRFMMEHHGTLITGYFFNKAVIEEGSERVNKNHFRYAGPKPQSKETAIVMLADACESAVRALKNPTLAQIEERVESLFHQRIDDDQFSECPVTFQEIQIVKDTFVRVLRAIQHERIEYQQNVMQELGRKEPASPLDAMLAKAGVGNALAQPATGIPHELNSTLAAIGAQEAMASQHHLSQAALTDLIAEANGHDHDDDDEAHDHDHEGCFPTNETFVPSDNGEKEKDAKTIPFDLPTTHAPEDVPDFAVENPEL